MGPQTSQIFKGISKSVAIEEIYGKSAELFADIVRSKLPEKKEYTLTDIGSSKGEFLSEFLKNLPEYQFNATVTETNPNALAENTLGKKVITNPEQPLPIPSKSSDVTLMRYVLQFNSLETQEKIVQEISRITKKIAIIQHGGADDINPEDWRSVVNQIFDDNKIPQLHRSGMFWSSASEVENFMNKNHVTYEKIQSHKIEGLSQVYIERYELNTEQAEHLKKTLGNKDYIIQTTWIIYPEILK